MTEEHAVADTPPVDAVPARRRPAWKIPLAIVTGLVVAAAAVGLARGLSGEDAGPATPTSGSPAAGPDTFALSGHLTLKQSSVTSGPCSGTGGYQDIHEGATVTVYDGGGRAVATGSLAAGMRVGLYCRFSVWVTGVPVGPGSYQVEVSHRGKATLSAEDAQAGKYEASLG
ncbi:hypothetical protein [Kitasatospora terrestris]